MYGRSFCSSFGLTKNCWYTTGTIVPMTRETNAQSPTAMIGRTHPRRQMFQTNSAAATIEITISRFSAGSCAATSVLLAPSTTPRVEKFSWNRA